VKKAAANIPTAPPGAPPETTPIPTPPPPTPPPPEPVTVPAKPRAPMPLMPTRPSVMDVIPRLAKQKQSTPLPSLFNTIVSPPPPPPPVAVPSASDAVIARCHSCGNKCQVIVSQ
jgi:hypothetical protein